MKNNSLIGPVIIVFLAFVGPAFIINIFTSLSDTRVWNNVDKHLDEFVYDHSSVSKYYHTFNLYDDDSTYVCSAFLNSRYGEVSIFYDDEIIASSINKFRSKRVYKTLIQKVPNEVNNTNRKKETLEHFKNMK